tara:strand:+ start:323 stop:856 length:534 start_codon:yes stop_codon:yes gene_type:complete
MALELNGTTGIVTANLNSALTDAIAKSVAIIADRKTAGTPGGTSTLGSWQTRDLNTEVIDVNGLVTLSSNQFTLQAGKYVVDWDASAYTGVNQHVSRIYNITDTEIVSESLVGRSVVNASTVYSSGSGYIDIASVKVFELQHRTQASVTTYGFGLPTNGYFTVSYEQYSIVKITKVG